MFRRTLLTKDRPACRDLLAQFLRSDVSRTSCDGREWFPKAIEVLDTARPNDMHTRYISNEEAKARHMPRSAKTISDNGSLGRETMLSSLFTGHVVGPKILTKIGRVNDKGEGQRTRDPSGRCRGRGSTSLRTRRNWGFNETHQHLVVITE